MCRADDGQLLSTDIFARHSGVVSSLIAVFFVFCFSSPKDNNGGAVPRVDVRILPSVLEVCLLSCCGILCHIERAEPTRPDEERNQLPAASMRDTGEFQHPCGVNLTARLPKRKFDLTSGLAAKRPSAPCFVAFIGPLNTKQNEPSANIVSFLSAQTPLRGRATRRPQSKPWDAAI